MESEYVIAGVASQPAAGSEFPPSCLKADGPDASFTVDLSDMHFPTLVSHEIKLEPDGINYVQTAHHVSPISLHIAEQHQPAEVTYQIVSETEEVGLSEPGADARKRKKKKHLKKKRKQSLKKGKFPSLKTGKGIKVLVRHPGVHIGNNSYICAECGESFKGRKNMAAHLESHSVQKPYPCNHCLKRFSESSVLLKHIRCEHKNGNDYVCSLCGKKFSTLKSLGAHMRFHSGDNIYICDICEKNFRHRSSLSRHRHVHRLEKQEDVPKRERAYGAPKLAVRDEAVDSDERNFLCTECGKRFSHRSSLSRHKQIHTQEKMHLHKNSKNSFSKSAGLKIRLKIHREKSHSSAQHAQSYSLETNPNQQLSQKGGRLYSCVHCEKNFNHSSSLSRHQQIHLQRPYPCTQCKRSFTTSLHLSKHLEFHKQKKYYTCSDCDKRFSHSSSLSRHRQIHTESVSLQ